MKGLRGPIYSPYAICWFRYIKGAMFAVVRYLLRNYDGGAIVQTDKNAKTFPFAFFDS